MVTFQLYALYICNLHAGFRRRTLRLSLALSSVTGALGKSGLRKEVGLLRPGQRDPKVLRHHRIQ